MEVLEGNKFLNGRSHTYHGDCGRNREWEGGESDRVRVWNGPFFLTTSQFWPAGGLLFPIFIRRSLAQSGWGGENCPLGGTIKVASERSEELPLR